MRGRTWMLGVFVLVGAAAAAAAPPEQKCQQGKNKQAGAYAACRQSAEGAYALTGDDGKRDTALAKCVTKFGQQWEALESKAAGACPSTGDEAAIQAYLDGATTDVATALAGGVLPDCPGGLVTCTGDLSSCQSTLGAARAGTATAGQVLAGQTFTSAAGDGVTGTMPNNGAVNLTPGTSDQGIAAGYHSGSGSVAGDADLAASNIKSGVEIFGVSGTVVAASGAATAGQVLSGVTFSNASGADTGTMPNNGAVNLTPGTSAQAIAAGYHSGSGSVAGDADLAAGNIKSGIDIFGVTGTVLPSQPLRTGQTQCDQGAGTLGACPGSPTGQDGTTLNGQTRSYTVNSSNGTITDNRTGLIWETLDDNNANGVHDYSATFTWYNAFKKIQVLNGNAAGCIAANSPDACCTGAGTGSCTAFAGQTDWRLPDVSELQTLADYGRSNPAIGPVFNTSCAAGCTTASCSCTQSNNYWSSTTNQGTPANAWDVGFNFGFVAHGVKSNTYSVRAVRGGS